MLAKDTLCLLVPLRHFTVLEVLMGSLAMVWPSPVQDAKGMEEVKLPVPSLPLAY